MGKIAFTKIQFRLFFKQNCIYWLTTGLIFGIVLFFISLLNGGIKTYLGPFAFEGVAGGISVIIIGPIIFLVFGLIFGLCSCVPFTRILRYFKK